MGLAKLAVTRYTYRMNEVTLSLPEARWATVPMVARTSLLQQLDALCQENAALRSRNRALQAHLQDCQAHQAQNAELQAQVSGLQAEVQELRARAGQNSSNSSRPPSSDLPQAPVQAKSPRRPSGRKRGGQPGHRGSFRQLLPPEQVAAVVVVVPRVCRHCGQPFPNVPARRPSRVWRHQVVELLKLGARVTEYQMQTRRCPACGKRTRGELPAGVSLRPFGPGLTAVAAMLSGRYRLSRREVRSALQEFWDITVSLGAITTLEQAQSVALKPVYTEVREAIPNAEVVNMDETGWREDKHRAWLWTVVTAALTVFHIDRHRSGAVVEALLGPAFAGVVGSDRYAAYHRFLAKQRALCYAHLKRDFQALVDRGGAAAEIGRWGLAEIQRLFALWHRFREGEFDRKALLRKLAPLKARMGRLLWRGEDCPDQKAAGLCRELNKWWEALWTFTQVEGVEPTNNVSERALRPAVLWRKGSFGSDSPAGSRFVERMLTVAATCRQQGRRLLDFLVAAGEAALNSTPAPSLLPAQQGV